MHTALLTKPQARLILDDVNHIIQNPFSLVKYMTFRNVAFFVWKMSRFMNMSW